MVSTNYQSLSQDRAPAPAIPDQRHQKYPAASCDKGYEISTFDGYEEDNDPRATSVVVEPDNNATATEYSALMRFDSNVWEQRPAQSCVVMGTAKRKARARRGEATDLHSISERVNFDVLITRSS